MIIAVVMRIGLVAAACVVGPIMGVGIAVMVIASAVKAAVEKPS